MNLVAVRFEYSRLGKNVGIVITNIETMLDDYHYYCQHSKYFVSFSKANDGFIVRREEDDSLYFRYMLIEKNKFPKELLTEEE